MMSVYNSTHQALEDAKNHLRRFVIATTPTAGEYYIPQLLAAYCSEHSDVRINLITDSINNIYNKLKLYEANFAIIDGRLTSDKYQFHSFGYRLSLFDCFSAASPCQSQQRVDE